MDSRGSGGDLLNINDGQMKPEEAGMASSALQAICVGSFQPEEKKGDKSRLLKPESFLVGTCS